MSSLFSLSAKESGKTSFYKERFSDYVHVNLDELHTRNKEKKLIEECFKEGKSLVIDNTNPTIEDRQRYIGPAKENGYEIIGYYFESKIGDCIKRNSQRQGKARIPDKAIAATYSKLQVPDFCEGFDELYYVMIINDEYVIEEWKDEI